jgi:hypothetical protein
LSYKGTDKTPFRDATGEMRPYVHNCPAVWGEFLADTFIFGMHKLFQHHQ